MIHLIKYVFQIKKKRFKFKWVQHNYRNQWIKKHSQSIYHAHVNVDLMEENVVKINGGIMINVDVSANNIMYVKNILFGIHLHVIVKMEYI